ncbi:hypothetical protein [Ligilactobacillus saerimneri]|nr:hypothetical protein [Ligilactobacillus saerimneri]MBU5309634.1 hypothetical protein [Ligilactobacillus saerimneri]
MVPTRSQRMGEIMREYPLTLAFAGLAVLYMLIVANSFVAALYFIMWSAGPAFIGETIVRYLVDRNAVAKYKLAELLVAVVQLALTCGGLWFFYTFLN